MGPPERTGRRRGRRRDPQSGGRYRLWRPDRTDRQPALRGGRGSARRARERRSEEHTSELKTLMRTSYAVFCLKKNTNNNKIIKQTIMKSLRRMSNIKTSTHKTYNLITHDYKKKLVNQHIQ